MECLIRMANELNNYVTFRPSGPGAVRPLMPCSAKLLIQVKRKMEVFPGFFPCCMSGTTSTLLLKEH